MEKLISKQKLKEQENLSEGLVNDFFKPVKLVFNRHNKYHPVKLYDIDKVLDRLKEEPISARIEFIKEHREKRSKASLQHHLAIRLKAEDLLNELINQIQIIELHKDTIKINAILSISNFNSNSLNMHQYIKSLLPRLNENSLSKLMNIYIVHNLIHFTPLYCRIHGCYPLFSGTYRQRYIDAIVNRATYVYLDCKEELVKYLTLINRFKFTISNLHQLQNRWRTICNPNKPITFYDELDEEYQNTSPINVKDYE